jgi:Fe-S cluster assembly ATP-binding protein
MLKIKNVSATVDTEEVLKDINLEIRQGEIHAILGPRHSGKSTLAHLIQGNPYIRQTSGTIQFKNKNINKLATHKRSKMGIFTSFQHPPEIEGITNLDLMKSLFEARTGKEFGQDLITAYIELLKSIDIDAQFAEEPINSSIRVPEDWKKSEIVQMIMLQPDVIILDEIDLEVSKDTLTQIIAMVKSYISEKDKALVIITHSQSLLEQLDLSHVHVLVDGEIRATGTLELYKRIIEDGYSQLS